MDTLGLAIVLLAGTLLVVLSRTRAATAPRLRIIPGLGRLFRGVGLSVEDGTRILVALGAGNLLSTNAASALAGLGALRQISRKSSVSDQPPVAVAGDASLALLAQDTLQAGYQAVGAAPYYQPTAGRLAGLSAFSSAAATIPILNDESVSTAALVGHFGLEAALLADAAERSHVTLVGASTDAASQAVLFASASETLIGEELFATPAYLGGGRLETASLAVEDIFRWLIVAALLVGAALRVFGVL